MLNPRKHRFISLCVTAFFIISQAVFLLPINTAQAQATMVVIVDPSEGATIDVPITVRAWVDASLIGQTVTLHISGTGLGVIPMTSSGGNYYTYYWDINSYPPIDLVTQMDVQVEDSVGTILEQSGIRTVTVNTGPSCIDPLDIYFIQQPSSPISGFVKIKAQADRDVAASMVNFYVLDNSSTVIDSHGAQIYDSANHIYSFDWYTDNSSYPDGFYNLKVEASDGGCGGSTWNDEDYFNNIEVLNNSGASVQATITYPQNSTEVNGSIEVTADIVTSAPNINNVNLHWPGSGMGYQPMTYYGGDVYKYSWDTSLWTDGNYEMYVIVEYDNYTQTAESSHIYININNSGTSSGSGSGGSGSTTTTDPPTTTQDSNINVYSPYGSTLSGSALLIAKTTVMYDSVEFIISGVSHPYYGTWYEGYDNITGEYKYKYYWDTTSYPDTSYQLKARAHLNGDLIDSQLFTFNVDNPGDNPPPDQTSTNETTTDTSTSENGAQAPEIKINFINPPQYITAPTTISAQTDVVADKVEFSITGPTYREYPVTYGGGNTYYFSLDPSVIPQGFYKVWAKAYKDGLYGSDYFGLSVGTEQPQEYGPQTGTQEEPFNIYFADKLVSPVTGEVYFTISGNKPITVADLIIESQVAGAADTKIKLAGVKKDDYHYAFYWPTIKYPNGFYKLNVIAKSDLDEASLYDSVEVKNYTAEKPATYDTTAPPETYESMKTDTSTQPPAIQPTSGEVPQVEIISYECAQAGISSREECENYMRLSFECRKQNILNPDECKQFMLLPYECRERSLLNWEECDQFTAIAWECRQAGITTQTDCKNYLYEGALPPECQVAGATTPEACNKTLFLLSMPDECREASAQSPEECDRIMSQLVYLPTECQQAGITDKMACEQHLMENYMPQECKEAGIMNMEECDYFLRSKYGSFDDLMRKGFQPMEEFSFYDQTQGFPEECQQVGATTPEECEVIMFTKHAPTECQVANILTPGECENHMRLLHMPEDCRVAGVTDELECEKILFINNAPTECTAVGITTPEECENLLFKEHAPPDCLEAGILTPEACKKYMFEKYGGMENIPIDKLPIACQKAEATTPEECDLVMKHLYLPRECEDQGITDELACEYYLNQKYMPNECKEAGAKTREECDKVMFKTYGPPECTEAGIEDDQECEDFMFNKYVPQVECSNIDSWQCRSSIKDRHLGSIVAKQSKYKKVKEKTKDYLGKSVSAQELAEGLVDTEIVLPFKDEVNIKVLATKEGMLLNEEDNLIQSPPVALMVDSDNDGLPDNMEERLGTDPGEADSDGDGYFDGEEVKNNHDPLGGVKGLAPIAPIDEAIIRGELIEHPKTKGEVKEAYNVEEVVNLAETTSTETQTQDGYLFTGQAEPNTVSTLYIYSDLPMVVTVTTDEFGNWQYELKQSLVEGEHEVYVTLNDNTGRVLAKSNPLNFFIKEAQAVSVQEYVADIIPIKASTQSENMMKYYFALAMLILVFGVFAFIFFLKIRKNWQQ